MATNTRRTSKSELDAKLDEALQDSFPASDPVAFIEPAPKEVGEHKPANRRPGKSKATRR